jgi:hypothetical protein
MLRSQNQPKTSSELVEAPPGIEPDQAISAVSEEIADRASTQLDFHSVEPNSFHPSPRFGAASRNIRAT